EQLQNHLVTETSEKTDLPKDHYYKLLCVPKDATTSQIKAAYYALTKRYHPDAGKDRHEISILKPFQDILNAYWCHEETANQYAPENNFLKMTKVDPKLELTFLEALHGYMVIDFTFLKKFPSCNGKSQGIV
uniref:J domain-containing protein n=1 Tax=Glossina austeni TaxID=7395 RepID=A0A1A9VY31_GLOAU